MRKLIHDFRLQGYSFPEIVGGWEQVCADIAVRHKINGRKAKPGPLFNALVLAFIGLSHEEQNRLMEVGIPELERLMNLPEAPQGPSHGAKPKPRKAETDESSKSRPSKK